MAAVEAPTRLLTRAARQWYNRRVSTELAGRGGMAEWPKAAVLKTVGRKTRGFESLSPPPDA